mgnify:CR=1 FL=1
MRHDPVAIGLVGCGLWGQAILRDLVALGCRVAVVDIDPGRRDVATRLGAVAVLGATARSAGTPDARRAFSAMSFMRGALSGIVCTT